MDAVVAALDAPPPSVAFVSAGGSDSVALLRNSGNMLCSCGRGEDGQLGHGDAEDRLVPTVLSGFDAPGITLVVCGADHTTTYSEDERQLYSWGWGDFGRLGHGNSSDVFTPQPVKALQGLRIKQIACRDSHCLAATMDGEVHSWGRNQNGLLGLATAEDSLLPQRIQAFEGVCVKMIAAGAEHTAAVTEDGDLYGCRYGNLGQTWALVIVMIVQFLKKYLLWRERRWCLLHVDGVIPLLFTPLAVCTLTVGASMVSWDMVTLKII